MVERDPEEFGVGGSIPSGGTNLNKLACEYGVMAAASRLGRDGEIRGGSSPSTRTKIYKSEDTGNA